MKTPILSNIFVNTIYLCVPLKFLNQFQLDFTNNYWHEMFASFNVKRRDGIFKEITKWFANLIFVKIYFAYFFQWYFRKL